MIGNSTRETINTNFTLQPPVAPPGGGGGGGGTPPVTPTLVFTSQPQNASTNPGETATFTVQAEITPENGPIAYQWYRSTDGGFAFAAITGATTNSIHSQHPRIHDGIQIPLSYRWSFGIFDISRKLTS